MMAHRFVLVSSMELTAWPQIVVEALADLGEVQVIPEEDVIAGHIELDCSTIMILDATVTGQLLTLISVLQAQCPHIVIIVATNLPTFKRTRAVSRFGAYWIERSTSQKEILSDIQAIINPER